MAGKTAKDRLRRLELLAVQLKQEGLCTVQGLAEQHGVSLRTISRDLALMREQGLPIEADRGRGGGVRLHHNWGVGRVNLSYAEAVDLLISIAVAEQMNSPMFLASLGSVRRQLVASFSPDKRRKVAGLKSRILVGVTASTYVQSGVSAPPQGVVQSLHQAFTDREMLDITYTDEAGTASRREIEPHFLLLSYPVWYVIAMDHLRAAPRTFRCDRISSAKGTGTPFRLRPRDDFAPALTAHQHLA